MPPRNKPSFTSCASKNHLCHRLASTDTASAPKKGLQESRASRPRYINAARAQSTFLYSGVPIKHGPSMRMALSPIAQRNCTPAPLPRTARDHEHHPMRCLDKALSRIRLRKASGSVAWIGPRGMPLGAEAGPWRHSAEGAKFRHPRLSNCEYPTDTTFRLWYLQADSPPRPGRPPKPARQRAGGL